MVDEAEKNEGKIEWANNVKANIANIVLSLKEYLSKKSEFDF